MGNAMKITDLLVGLTLLAAAIPAVAAPFPEQVRLLLDQAQGGPSVVPAPIDVARTSRVL